MIKKEISKNKDVNGKEYWKSGGAALIRRIDGKKWWIVWQETNSDWWKSNLQLGVERYCVEFLIQSIIAFFGSVLLFTTAQHIVKKRNVVETIKLLEK